MKRLLVTAALTPLALAAAAHAETKITTAITAPLHTSTAANGARDDLTIDATGSVKPTAAGAAVTLDSDNKVKSAGAIGFNNVSSATGVLVLGGHTGAVSNAAGISVVEDYTPADADKDGDPDGPFAQGSGRFGIRAIGPAAFTGDIRNETGASITVEGNDSAGVSIETQLTGSLVNAGTISVTGDRSVGVGAGHVTGDVKITGGVVVQGEGAVGVSLGDVDGGVLLQNAITATGFRSTNRLADDVRAKLDADDLKIGGPAVRITGSIGKGVLIDRPPADNDKNEADEDKDGVPDASESTGVITSYGSAPALAIGAADQATTIGAVGTGEAAFGLVNKGTITGVGVNDGIGSTALRVGEIGGGATTVVGGINNLGGSIVATAFGADVTAQGDDAVGVLINSGAVVPTLRNSGTIQATLAGGSQSAKAIVDRSGSLALVDNTGVISAAVTPKAGSSAVGAAVAIDLSANTAGAMVRQTKVSDTAKPAIIGDVLFGFGADQLQLLGGALNGSVSFGAGADSLRIDGGASFAGRLTDSDGALSVQVQDGRLAVSNVGAIAMSSLQVGAKGVLAFTLDPAHATNTKLQVTGAASFADGAKIELNLVSLLKSPQNFQLVTGQTVTTGSTGVALSGAPFLYAATLKNEAGTLSADFRPKTAADLGLNRSGAEAYSAVLGNLDNDPAIAGAFLAQQTQAGFQGLYDQMLPDHSGASLMSLAAISAGISQAVGQPLRHDGQGGSALWAQEIAFHIDRDREQAAGFTSQGYGLAAGGEIVGVANALGLEGSFVTVDYKDRGAAAGERVVMNFAEGGAYWRLRRGGFQADARAALGYVWFDGDRRLDGSGLSRSTDAKWNGWLVDAHAGASYVLTAGRLYAVPQASLDYVRLNEDGYQEKGGGAGVDLKVSSREGDLFTGQVLVALGYEFGEDGAFWSPELKLGWRQKIAGGPGDTTAQFQGGAPFVLDPETPPSGGAIVRLGVTTWSDQMFFALDGGATLDDHTQEYDVRGTIRFRF